MRRGGPRGARGAPRIQPTCGGRHPPRTDPPRRRPPRRRCVPGSPSRAPPGALNAVDAHCPPRRAQGRDPGAGSPSPGSTPVGAPRWGGGQAARRCSGAREALPRPARAVARGRARSRGSAYNLPASSSACDGRAPVPAALERRASARSCGNHEGAAHHVHGGLGRASGSGTSRCAPRRSVRRRWTCATSADAEGEAERRASTEGAGALRSRGGPAPPRDPSSGSARRSTGSSCTVRTTIVFDVRSTGALPARARGALHAPSRGGRRPLPPLPTQYADFAGGEERGPTIPRSRPGSPTGGGGSSPHLPAPLRCPPIAYEAEGRGAQRGDRVGCLLPVAESTRRPSRP